MHLNETILKNIRKICEEQQEITALYLHGSFAAGNPTPLSDIDLAVLLDDSIHQNRYLEKALSLEDLFCSQMPDHNFDVRIINHAPILVQGNIITDGRLLFCSDEEKLADFQERVILPYLDFKIDYDRLISEIYNRHIHDR